MSTLEQVIGKLNAVRTAVYEANAIAATWVDCSDNRQVLAELGEISSRAEMLRSKLVNDLERR